MRDFEEFFRHIKSLGYRPDICIDVGAGYGTGSIYSAFPFSHHIVFEPVAENKQRLEERLKDLSHSIHICGLMSESGTMQLAKFGTENLGSTFMTRETKQDATYIDVPVKTLNDYVSEIGENKNILLKIDCQGADIDVVKGASRVLPQVDLIIIESSLFPFWGPHHPTIQVICDYMNELDFTIYDILDPSYRPYDNALGQVDLVFAKKDGVFREVTQWKSNSPEKSFNDITPSSSIDQTDKLLELLNQKNAEISHLNNLLKIKEEKNNLSVMSILKKLKNHARKK